MADDLHPHDVVELDSDIGAWPAGTIGTVVDDFPGGVVVELVGPSGATLDMLDLPVVAVHRVEAGGAQASGVPV